MLADLSALDLGIAGLAAVGSYLAIAMALRVVHRAEFQLAQGQTRGVAADLSVLGEVLDGTNRVLIVIAAALIGLSTLDLPEPWRSRVGHLCFVALVLQLALWLHRAIDLALKRHFDRGSGVRAWSGASATLLSWASKIVLWSVVVLAVLANFGVNTTTFLASLGVGGVALALAVQNILRDLFASLSIAADKPFEVGDLIVVGAVIGTIEDIGLKSTRIRALGGQQVIMSNESLLGQTINNYRQMVARRIQFQFVVSFATTVEQAEAIPGIVKGLVEADPRMRFDRTHLKAVEETGLAFEVVYIVQVPDYDTYMDLQQQINLGLMRALRQLGVSFAWPTRTVHVAGTG